MDITSGASSSVNAGLNKVIAKYIEGSQWKDALKIIKLIVARSSSLAAPPVPFNVATPTLSSYYGSMTSSMFSAPLAADTISIASGSSSNMSFTESDVGNFKRELPGRTMEFTFDLSLTPIIGRRLIMSNVPSVSVETVDGAIEDGKVDGGDMKNKADDKQVAETCSPTRRSFSYAHTYNENNSNWKKPWLSQSRTRERLVSLLTTFGQRVGLPKSPSVIFSQSSDVMDRQSSVASSTEDISVTQNDASADSKLEETGHGEFGLFKDFDFLEYELESQEGESMDNFNWGVRRRSLCNLDTPDDLTPYSPTRGIVRGEPSKEADLSSEDEEAGSVSPSLDRENSGQNETDSTAPNSQEPNRPSSVLSCSSSHSLVSDNDS